MIHAAVSGSNKTANVYSTPNETITIIIAIMGVIADVVVSIIVGLHHHQTRSIFIGEVRSDFF